MCYELYRDKEERLRALERARRMAQEEKERVEVEHVGKPQTMPRTVQMEPRRTAVVTEPP